MPPSPRASSPVSQLLPSYAGVLSPCLLTYECTHPQVVDLQRNHYLSFTPPSVCRYGAGLGVVRNVGALAQMCVIFHAPPFLGVSLAFLPPPCQWTTNSRP